MYLQISALDFQSETSDTVTTGMVKSPARDEGCVMSFQDSRRKQNIVKRNLPSSNSPATL